jgi:hypothetical protein
MNGLPAVDGHRQCIGDFAKLNLGHHAQHLFLALEIVEEGSLAHACRFGNLLHRDAGEAALGKQLQSAVKEPHPRLKGVAFAAAHARLLRNYDHRSYIAPMKRSVKDQFPSAELSGGSGVQRAARCAILNIQLMIFSRDYIGYLARRTVKHLIDAKMITTTDLKVVERRVTEALTEELSLEDRINDEVRVILDAYSEEMRKTGAQYAEMFKKVKNELTKKYKAVL